MAVSKILKDRTAEEIQHPTVKIFEVDGKTFPILPMPDGILVTVTKEIGSVTSLLMAANAKSHARLQEIQRRQEAGATVTSEEIQAAQFSLGDLTYQDALELIPALVQVLLPSASKIIAASLRQTEDWVQDTLFYRDRLRALRLILEAEDIALLVGEVEALGKVFTILSPEPAPTT